MQQPTRSIVRTGASLLAFGALVGGAQAQEPAMAVDPQAPVGESGIRVPGGFEASVVHDGVGRARHLAITDDGRIYVRLREMTDGGGIAALMDEDGDGRAETVEYFGDTAGTGAAIQDGWLYVASETEVFRYRLPAHGLVPDGGPETVVEGFPEQDSHAAKSLALDDDGNLYVNVGAPSNACQEQDRTQGSPGQEPCPLLDEHAGIWRFDASQTGQSFAAGERFATGVRNAVALEYDPASDAVYLVMHGRDQLHDLFPDLYTVEENAEQPGEEFHKLEQGSNLGWPYTYWDWQEGARMVGPEYGGDGETRAEEGAYQAPMIAFPGHWAPNDLQFYNAEAFPEAFQGGAFIAFHGSWNRAPQPQAGYKVVFVPFETGSAGADYHVFADGFPGERPIEASDEARFRPMGLAVGPEGALYIADSVAGRIWRIVPAG